MRIENPISCSKNTEGDTGTIINWPENTDEIKLRYRPYAINIILLLTKGRVALVMNKSFAALM